MPNILGSWSRTGAGGAFIGHDPQFAVAVLGQLFGQPKSSSQNDAARG
jgi:hypothetical protein